MGRKAIAKYLPPPPLPLCSSDPSCRAHFSIQRPRVVYVAATLIVWAEKVTDLSVQYLTCPHHG